MRVWLLILALSSSGCGVLFQTIAGWREDESHIETHRRPLSIETEPKGAMVLRESEGEGEGAMAAVGRGPVVDALPYDVEVTTSTPIMGWMFSGLLADIVVSSIVFGYCAANEECGLRVGLPFAVTVLGGELTFMLLASRRESSVVERELKSGGAAYWAMSGALRSPRVGVRGRSPDQIVLAIDGGRPIQLRLAKGAPISILVKGAIGSSADAALLLAGIDEVAKNAVTELGYPLAPPGIEPVPLAISVDVTDGGCRALASLGAAPVIAEAERIGPCRGNQLPELVTGMILGLFELP